MRVRKQILGVTVFKTHASYFSSFLCATEYVSTSYYRLGVAFLKKKKIIKSRNQVTASAISNSLQCDIPWQCLPLSVISVSYIGQPTMEYNQGLQSWNWVLTGLISPFRRKAGVLTCACSLKKRNKAFEGTLLSVTWLLVWVRDLFVLLSW